MIDSDRLFDIAKHEFEDGDIKGANTAIGQRLFLNFKDGGHVQLCEKDVIALANHYGYLTHLDKQAIN